MASRIFLLLILICHLTFTLANYPVEFLHSGELNTLEKQERLVNYRLPNNTIPVRYDVTLNTRIDIGDFNFSGIVQIEIVATENTSFITLHQRELVISAARLILPDASVVQLNTSIYDPVTEFLTFNLTFNLETNNTFYLLEIEYNGVLRNDQGGFYRSSYLNENNVISWLATTQFEPLDARHAFPCYDEPSRKATFTIRINHGGNYTAISNMPVISIAPNSIPGEVTTTFQTSVPMSTYLVAFVVSNFDYISNNATGSTIPQRVFARPTAHDYLELALEAGEKIIDALATYLEVPYSLPKMDQFAIPDFSAGAMENWGLITYREPYLIYDPAISTYTNRANIVQVVSHELAHQWFGNLVTPVWWTYLWLNEGFADLYESVGTDIAYPEWRIMERYVVSSVQYGLASDSGNLRPMTHYAGTPNEIGGLFDLVAYTKSGAVIRMFLHAITEETFKNGLKRYLINKQFDSATQEDLFANLDFAILEYGAALPSNLNITTLFNSWSTQNGYPVLIVNRNYENGTVNITQERYQSSLTSPFNYATYWIPYNFATANNSDFNDTRATDWLAQNERSRVFNVTNLSATDWIIFNKQQAGYYRVQYDDYNYNLIANELNANHTRIHLLNRAQIIDDLFNFGRTNRVNYNIILNVVIYLRNEIEYAPWQSAVNGLTFIGRMLAGSSIEYYNIFRQLVSEVIDQFFTSVGIEDDENEQFLRKYSRTIAILWACNSGLESCLSATRNRTREYIYTNRTIHQNVIGSVLCGGLRNTTSEDFSAILARFHATQDASLRTIFINSLGCSWNTSQLTSFLENSISTANVSFVSSSQRALVFQSVYQNSHIGLQLSIEFLFNNPDAILAAYGQYNLETLLVGMSQRISGGSLRFSFENLLHLLSTRNYISQVTVGRAALYLIENFNWLYTHGDHLRQWIEGASIIA